MIEEVRGPRLCFAHIYRRLNRPQQAVIGINWLERISHRANQTGTLDSLPIMSPYATEVTGGSRNKRTARK